MARLSTKSDLIAEALAEEIIRGEIAPDSRLAQDHIALRFKSSHVPVREALQRLVQMELATAEPRRGVRVNSLSSQDHLEIREMRLALEPIALRHASKNMSKIKIDEIEVVRIACDNASEPIGWEIANRRFHMKILEPCGRPMLLQRIAQLQRLSAQRFHSKWHEHWVKSSDRDHAAIVRSLAVGDGEAAAQILLRHLRR